MRVRVFNSVTALQHFRLLIPPYITIPSQIWYLYPQGTY
nr:MAG TPA: hypothetical protein [Bacteriophage sp.]